ncbi:hypothetical protein RND81_05G268900 [Saponaria officinalis]
MGIGGGGGGGGLVGATQIRPNSMAEHARQLKIPPPMGPLKCPRCQSTNTKFCYYNNYNLTQPRHLCKACRRYWTHGGALRNVPVGGGCRKNKRSSSTKSSSGGGGSSSSKLCLSTPAGVNISSPTNAHSGGANSMSYMTSNLQNISHLGGMSNMGLICTGGPMLIHPPSNTNPSGIIPEGLAGRGFPQQQVHQFPNFLGGFQLPGSSSVGAGEGGGGLYSSSFQNFRHYNNNQGMGDECDENNHEHQQQQQQQLDDNTIKSSSRNMKSEVKMEVNRQQGLNLTNEMMIMGVTSSADNNNDNNNNNVTNVDNNSNNNSNNNNQYWGGNIMNAAIVTSMWTDLSGLNSSSTSHLL